MATSNRFDIIIAGAGAAGLSLLWRILDSPVLNGQRILLIDKSFTPLNDKTWCYWEDLTLPEAGLLHHTWNKLLVRVSGNTYSGLLQHYKYHCLRSEDFTQSILHTAKEYPNISMIETDIQEFSHDREKGVVHTSRGDFHAEYIFQSVKKPRKFETLKVDVSLLQHFLGWEIEAENDLFDPKTATFMDFEVPQANGITFMYLLPFSKKRALVEYTIFSKKTLPKKQYEKQISGYLKNNYGLGKNQFSTKREEFGVIPMDDRKYPAWYCQRVLNIGTAAGLPKPTTGYTFSRIQNHAEKIVYALEKGVNLPESQSSSYRFRVYDLMMLYMLACEPDESLAVFNNLFKKNSFDLVLHFLAEQTNPLQELDIFSGMPYLPFFRSVYRMKHRIFTGA